MNDLLNLVYSSVDPFATITSLAILSLIIEFISGLCGIIGKLH